MCGSVVGSGTAGRADSRVVLAGGRAAGLHADFSIFIDVLNKKSGAPPLPKGRSLRPRGFDHEVGRALWGPHGVRRIGPNRPFVATLFALLPIKVDKRTTKG